MNNINSAISNINKSHKMLNKIEEKLKNKIVLKPIIQVYVNKKTPIKKVTKQPAKKRKVVTKTPIKKVRKVNKQPAKKRKVAKQPSKKKKRKVGKKTTKKEKSFFERILS